MHDKRINQSQGCFVIKPRPALPFKRPKLAERNNVRRTTNNKSYKRREQRTTIRSICACTICKKSNSKQRKKSQHITGQIPRAAMHGACKHHTHHTAYATRYLWIQAASRKYTRDSYVYKV